MKLWIDDLRKAPPGWIHARNYQQAIMAIRTGAVDEISFDHDLGEERTGYDVAVFVEQMASQDLIPRMKWGVHSANPVGKIRIQAAMKSADRLWQAWAETKAEALGG